MATGRAAAFQSIAQIETTHGTSHADVVRYIADALSLRCDADSLPSELSESRPAEGSVTLGIASLDLDGIAAQFPGLDWNIRDGALIVSYDATFQAQPTAPRKSTGRPPKPLSKFVQIVGECKAEGKDIAAALDSARIPLKSAPKLYTMVKAWNDDPGRTGTEIRKWAEVLSMHGGRRKDSIRQKAAKAIQNAAAAYKRRALSIQ